VAPAGSDLGSARKASECATIRFFVSSGVHAVGRRSQFVHCVPRPRAPTLVLAFSNCRTITINSYLLFGFDPVVPWFRNNPSPRWKAINFFFATPRKFKPRSRLGPFSGPDPTQPQKIHGVKVGSSNFQVVPPTGPAFPPGTGPRNRAIRFLCILLSHPAAPPLPRYSGLGVGPTFSFLAHLYVTTPGAACGSGVASLMPPVPRLLRPRFATPWGKRTAVDV